MQWTFASYWLGRVQVSAQRFDNADDAWRAAREWQEITETNGTPCFVRVFQL
jgi:hypothetical protein